MGLLNINQTSVNVHQNENRFSSFKTFFKEGIDSTIIRKPQPGMPNTRVRILPSFDFTQYGYDSFQMSVAPYRTEEDRNMFSGWVAFVKGYTFFGDLWAHILSPATLTPGRDFPAKGQDPITDLRSFLFGEAKQGKTLTPEEDLLINGSESPKIFIKVPAKPRTFAIMNALVENAQTRAWDPKIIILSEQAFNKMAGYLKVKAGRGDKLVSEAYPEFLFGDVTHPSEGCIFEVRQVLGDMKNRIVTMCPSADNETLTGYVQMPIDDAALASRKVLCDPDNVLDIWTYQRILDQLCKEPSIPVETLQRAEAEGVFRNGTLNLDLREEGIALIEQRNAKKAAADSEVYTAPAAPVSRPVSTASQPMAALGRHAPEAPEAMLNPSTPPNFESAPEVNPVSVSHTPVDEAEQPKSDSKLTPEEQEKFDGLVKKANQGALSPAELGEYIALTQKANG